MSAPSLTASSSTTNPAHPAKIESEPTPTVQWDPKKSWRHMVAGAVGGMTGAAITAPLDVVKTRLQSDMFRVPAKSKSIPLGDNPHLPHASSSASSLNPKANVSSLPKEVEGALKIHAKAQAAKGKPTSLLWNFVETAQMLKAIAKTEGVGALWRGIGPTLVGVIPARSIQFFTYGNGKLILAENFNNGREASWVHLLAAANAGIWTGVVTNPIWVVKTRLQLSQHSRSLASASTPTPIPTSPPKHSKVYASLSPSPSSLPSTNPLHPSPTSTKPPFTNAFTCVKYIVRTEGVKGLYKGLSASMLGVSEGVIQWTVYEKFKGMGVSEKGGKLGEWTGVLGAAGGAKMLAALITYPHEVLRTRLRQPIVNGIPRYTGLLQTLKLVIAEEGVRSLYGGLTAHMMRVVPNAAAMYSVYELALRW